MGGGPRGRNVISLEPCISARPQPGFDRANFHIMVQTRAGPPACFRLLHYVYILDIHQLVMTKIAALVETTQDRVATVARGV